MADKTSIIKLGVLVDQSMNRRATSDIRSAWKDIARAVADGDKAILSSHTATVTRLLALDADLYRKRDNLRKADDRAARASEAAMLRACAEIEAKTRPARQALASKSGSGTGGVDTRADISALAELDKRLRAGLVSRQDYVRQVLALADQEGLSQNQLVALYGKAMQARNAMARESMQIAEAEKQRVAGTAQAEVRAVNEQVAASHRRAASIEADEKKVAKAYDAETKKANEHFSAVIAEYRKAVAATEKGDPGAAGSGKSRGGAGGPVEAGDILNAVAIGAAYNAIKEQISAGIEQVSKFDDAVSESDAAFGRYSGHIKDWAKTTTQSMGLSETAAIAAAAKLGNVITDMGLTGETAAAMSPKLIQFAADLGSFEHVGTEKVLNAVTMAMEGNLKGLKNLGIVITQNDMKQEAFKEGLIATKKDGLDAATKAQVLYTLMLKEGEKASGDFAKRQGDIRNEQAKLTADMEDAQKKLGQDITPAYTGFLKVLDGIFQHFKDGPSDIEKFAGAILATVGAGGALTLMAAKVGEIVTKMGGMSVVGSRIATLGGMMTPGGLSAGAGLSGFGTAASIAGGSVLALPAIVGYAGYNAIADQQGIVTKIMGDEAQHTPRFQQTAGRIQDTKDRNEAIDKRLAEIKKQRAAAPDSLSELASAGAGAGRAPAGVETDPSAYAPVVADASNAAASTSDGEIRALEQERRLNVQAIVRMNKVYKQEYADFKADAKKQNVRGHLHDNDPQITHQKQPKSDADKAAEAAEARKAEEDAAAAVETTIKGQRENLQKNLTVLQEQYKAGKGPDTLLDVITKTAIHLRDAELAEAQAAHDRQVARDPKHTKDADATFAAATKTAGDNLRRFRADDVPKLTDERNKAVDEGTIKLIEERLKRYTKDDTDAQRNSVMADVYAMRLRLRTSTAQTEALDKVTEARRKVQGEILESDERYFQQVEENRKLSADLAERQQQAALDLLNAELDETHDLTRRTELRGQIRDNQTAQAVTGRKETYADITAEAFALSRKQNGKLTPEQEAGFQARMDIADQIAATATQQAGTGLTKGTERDTRDDYSRQAREIREQIDLARTPEEKANLAGQASVLELQAAGPLSDAQRKAIVERQNREIKSYLIDGHFDWAGRSLLDAAKTGDKGALTTGFTQAATGRQYAGDNSQIAELIAREVKMLLDASELPGSKLLNGDNKQMVRDRLLTLKGMANKLGDVDLVLKIDADVKRLDEKLLTASQKFGLEMRNALIGGVGTGVESYTNTMLDILGHGVVGRRDPYKRGQSARSLFRDAGDNFLRQQAADVQGQLSRGVGRLVTDNLHDLFKPKTDAQGNIIGPSSIGKVVTDIHDGHIGRDLEESAKKAGAFLHIGGADAGKEIAEGAATIFTAAEALEAAFHPGKGKKRKYGGIIGTVLGGIAGSFIGGPGGGWKAGSALGGQIGGLLSFDKGSWELPRDMIAQVHKGEMIVPAEPAAAIRSGVGIGGEVHDHYHTHNHYGPMVDMDIDTIHDRADADHMMDRLTDHIDGYVRR